MSEQQTERRLEIEAKTMRLATLSHPFLTPTMGVQTVRIEVSYADADDREHAGFILVNVPEFDTEGLDENEAMEKHPANLAHDTAHEWLDEQAAEKSWTYTSVDDAFPA